MNTCVCLYIYSLVGDRHVGQGLVCFCLLLVYLDSFIVCVQPCKKAEAFAGQTGERGHTCVYMWHTVPHNNTHSECLDNAHKERA